MKKYLLIISILMYSTLTILAQDLKSPESIVQTLFDGMRNGDSTAVKACFHEEAVLHSTYKNKEGLTKIHEGNVEEFVVAVGSPHDEVWDERISNLEIKIDGTLANAWMDYSFYLGDKLSHCGVNSMHFVLVDGEWKIFQLMDTRRRKTCD